MKVTFNPKAIIRSSADLRITNVKFHENDASFKAEASPFGDLGYAPDRWKAYMEFDICHSLPAILGPVSEGFDRAYTPETLAMSHASLLHQQVNLNHLLKAYDLEEGKDASKATKDRIVGCVVATYFPDPPQDTNTTGTFGTEKSAASGKWPVYTDPETAPCIRACAVIFKLADGVNRVVGDHQASRKTQSVLIETVTTYDNLGVLVPSRGIESIQPLLSITDQDILDAISLDPLKLGKVNGEQAVFIYGIGRPVDFRGVGITPRPAEAEAKIVSFAANKPKQIEGGTLVAMAASLVDQELIGRKIEFKSTRRVGVVRKVVNEGKATLTGNRWGIEATKENPVLEIEMPDKRRVLRKMAEVAGGMKG